MARCTKYNIGEVIPERCKENLAKYGYLERVDATPEDGKIIVDSHGEVIGGKWIEVIDEEKTPEEIKQARMSFNIRYILDACVVVDAENQNTVLTDKISAILVNPIFAGHLAGAAGTVDLSDAMTIQAMTSFTAAEITAIKSEI
jgi:hypothetical protein